MSWLWLNVSLMAAFSLAVAGIPLWLVLRRPDFGAARADQPGQLPALIAACYPRSEAATAPRASAHLARHLTAEDEAWMRELAGVTSF